MEKMTIQQVKSCELDILMAFAGFCDKHGLNYFLAYGTLLGAVRHGGFIPWDDDIDVVMLRDDYKKLCSLLEKKKIREDLDWITLQNGKWNEPEGKVVNANTRGYRCDNFETGLWIDVFPLDNYDKKVLSLNVFWRRVHIAKCTEHFEPSRKGFAKFLLKHLFCWKSLTSISEEITNRALKVNTNGKLSNMVWASGNNDVIPKEWVTSYTMITFEGKEFKTVANVDAYLKQIYGDYMRLPPKSQQKSHGIDAYWISDKLCMY